MRKTRSKLCSSKRRPKKFRSDSRVARLGSPALVKLAGWLLRDDLSYEAAAARCRAEFGAEITASNVGTFFHSHERILRALLSASAPKQVPL